MNAEKIADAVEYGRPIELKIVETTVHKGEGMHIEFQVFVNGRTFVGSVRRAAWGNEMGCLEEFDKEVGEWRCVSYNGDSPDREIEGWEDVEAAVRLVDDRLCSEKIDLDATEAA